MPLKTIGRQQYFDRMLACSNRSQASIWLAQIVASWQMGDSVLPDALGLATTQFKRLLSRSFPGYSVHPDSVSGKTLDFGRMLEKEDLEQLLRHHAARQDEETEWIISLVVASCLGSDHLWQDLGLWSRKDLSALLRHFFPDLAARNDKDMKWKKFLYKQLCEAEGLYVCRAPSCEVCKDYPDCFGEEN